jgi:hypothetical protein
MELKKIRTALGLLNSMVNCKESHTKQSMQVLREAMEELESIENPIKLEEGKTYTFYV